MEAQGDSLRNSSYDENNGITMTNVLETMEIIKSLVNTFDATNDTDYIDNAIGLAEALPRELPLVQEFVTTLTTMRSIRRVTQASTTNPAPAIAGATYSPMNQLSNLYIRRYDQCGGDEDLNKAVAQIEETLAVTNKDHPGGAGLRGQLGRLLHERYKRLGNLEDLENSIKHGREAVAATPANHPDRASRLNNLSNGLGDRYSRLGDMEDLENSIKHVREAIAATPANHPNRASRLNNLGNRLGDRYSRLGDMEDLENSIKHVREAIAATPANHPDRASRLNNLSNRLGDRYSRLGDMEDLENSIKHDREALAATPANHPDRASMLNNLSNGLSNRYSRLGDMKDLEDSIKHVREALAATPAGHPDRASRLSDLSVHLGNRYSRLGDMEDLEDSIKHDREALAATPASHPDRASRLSNSSVHLGYRYSRLGDMEDLENSIKHCREALAATPANHPDRASMLNNLSNHLGYRYSRLGDMKDIENAIKSYEDSIASTSPNHPHHAKYLSGLQMSLFGRFMKSENIEDIQYAIKVGQEAWSSVLVPPKSRIDVANNTSALLVTVNRLEEASSLFDEAVKLLPDISPQHLQRINQSQELGLSDASQIAPRAASVALKAGKTPAHSLMLLELGRGIIIGTAIDYRSDLSELQAKHSDIFTRFDNLRIEIDSPLIYNDDTFEEVRERRINAVKEFAEIRISIRELPGFEGFQLPPSLDDLMAVAVEGPIVIINSTEWRSDAIIVTNSTVKALPLPGLIFEEVEEQMRQLRQDIIQGKSSTYRSRNQQLHEFLLWLWSTTVKPVFEELDFHPIDDDSALPRVWWMGTGPLATAPFHAAGDYSDMAGVNNAMSRAISSYIPTIKALSYAREKRLELLSGVDTKLLLVTMPTTPKKNPLPSAEQEACMISSVVSQATGCMLLESPSATEVLEELESSHAVHFACHGVPDEKSPSESHLLLFKDNVTIDRLTIKTIADKRIKNAQIAYLSACSTADNRVAKLADESIHIASGFQLAGFSHVLATLWKSNDAACLEVAVEFYRLLFDGEGSKDHAKVSHSFHRAVKGLWKKYSRQPIIWTSFIHSGA